jgi:hypothetical protein
MSLSPDCVSSANPDVTFPGINGTHWGSEDCLFLNVRVPRGVKDGDKVPVLHFLSGSAYAFGSKDEFYTSGDSIGLFDGIEGQKKGLYLCRVIIGESGRFLMSYFLLSFITS